MPFDFDVHDPPVTADGERIALLFEVADAVARRSKDRRNLALVPLTGTVLQPANAVPASVKATLPVGTAAVTVAVRVTVAPAFAGLAELKSDVLLGALLTPCDNVALVELLFAASPE